MQRFLILLTIGLALAQLGVSAAAAGPGTGRNELGDVLLQFTPATHYIWTDSLWYQQGGTVKLYWTADPQSDPYPYTIFVYLENIRTGQRQYVANGALVNDVRDVFGNAAGGYQPAALPQVSKQEVISIPAPAVGNWHFVAELRDISATRVIKSAWAKFNVVREIVTLGENAQDTEISSDTTWTADTVYRLRYQVFVNSGATLTIEPGTLVVASGQNAVLVAERGGKIVADGRRELPIVMTCDNSVGQRQSGCWAGLILLGNAPVNEQNPIAEGVIPATRPVYGGDNADDSSGVFRYVRVEFAGVDFTNEIQPNAFGFHGVGRGTVIDHIQAHEGEDDGIEFFGGTANLKYFVSDGSKDDSLDWTFGWSGKAQFGYVRLDEVQGDRGIEADNNENGFDNSPRSAPDIRNVTFIGSSVSNRGIYMRRGSAGKVRNCVVQGFQDFAVRYDNDETVAQAAGGNLVVSNCTLWQNAGGQTTLAEQVHSSALPFVSGAPGMFSVDTKLRNVRYEGNPDPRPLDMSPVGTVGADSVAPSDGFFDTSARFHGGFGPEENWLEEWTFFGSEEDYQVQ